MKTIVCTLLCLTLLFTVGAMPAVAEDATATVTVTIADAGSLAVAAETVEVTDSDNDGALTVSDALYAAHEAYFEGGAAAGYEAYLHEDYGLSLGMLWGDNSGNFGYALNNASCRSLADIVADGDALIAYIYADTTYYADMVSYFDTAAVSVQAGEIFTLTLLANGYDENWNPVVLPVEGAVITVNGEKTAFATNAEGEVTLTLDTVGDAIISAVSDTAVLVPPVCKAAIEASQTTTTTMATTTAATTTTTVADDTTSPRTGAPTAALAVLTALALGGSAAALAALKARV